MHAPDPHPASTSFRSRVRSRLPHLLVSGAVLAGCTTSPAGPDPLPVFVPDFTFVWQNQADPTNVYNLLTDQIDQQAGDLTGEEEKVLPGDATATFSALEGRFSGRTVTFTVDRGDLDAEVDCTDGEGICVEFTGRFRDDDTIDLTSTADGAITLVRFTDL